MKRKGHYSKHAGLVLIAQRFEALKLWPTVCEEVHIKQKVRVHQPMDKLLDCLINILAGGVGLVEINTRLRADLGLQRAFGRMSCAEQSTISDTLNACTPSDVGHMREAITRILQRHGKVMDRATDAWLVLDVDTVGLVAGTHGEGVTKGFFSGKRDQRGRQLGRVLATDYDEIVVERLYAGTRQLETSLHELVGQSEVTLKMSAKVPENTVLRVDAGGGSDANINALLVRGYHVLTKAHSWQRAEKLARSVQHWERDPSAEQRWVGWVTQPHTYLRPTRQLMLRTVTAKGTLKHRMLITSLSDEQLCACFKLDMPIPAPWPLLYAYDLRGGGIETQNRCDQQGLGLGHRNKRLFAAQEMLVLLGQLAHNFLIWMRNELMSHDPRFRTYGLKRMVRDVLAIDGVVHFDQTGAVCRVDLNPLHPLAAPVATTWKLRYV